MEAPIPISTPDYDYIEKSIFKFNLKYQNNTFLFILYEINNSKIKIQAMPNDYQDHFFAKYVAEINHEQLKKKNKYFKMFETFEDFKNDFVGLCKANNIKITNFNDKELLINLNLMIISDNLINIVLIFLYI